MTNLVQRQGKDLFLDWASLYSLAIRSAVALTPSLVLRKAISHKITYFTFSGGAKHQNRLSLTMLLKYTKQFRIKNPVELKGVPVISLITVNNPGKLGGPIFIPKLWSRDVRYGIDQEVAKRTCKHIAVEFPVREPIHLAMSEAFGTVADTKIKRHWARSFIREIHASRVLPRVSPRIWTSSTHTLWDIKRLEKCIDDGIVTNNLMVLNIDS